jgi:putative FmdB family regulatory protein
MPIFEYVCSNCNFNWEDIVPTEYRDLPTTYPCPRCQQHTVEKAIRAFSFSVPEGSCGNAANGYSSTHGDAENFKAKSKGEPIPYPKDKI